MNCQRPASGGDANWVGFFTNRRCRACNDYRNAHGVEKQPGQYVSYKDHLFWVAEGNDDVY